MKLLIALCTAALLTAACSSGGGETTGDSGAEPAAGGGPGAVAVSDFKFDAETTTVKVGDKVEWTVAEDSSAHTVKFDDEESKELAAGDTFSKTFDEAGEFSYLCGIHPQMTGNVTVE